MNRIGQEGTNNEIETQFASFGQDIERLSERFIILRRKQTRDVFIGELVKFSLKNQAIHYGKVVEITESLVVVFFSESLKGSAKDDNLQFIGEEILIPVTNSIINSCINIKDLYTQNIEYLPSQYVSIIQPGFSPHQRTVPSRFYQTGVSLIDLFMPIVRGQKIGLFTSPEFDYFDLVHAIGASQIESNEVSIYVLIGVSQAVLERYQSQFQNTDRNYIIIYSLENQNALEKYLTAKAGAIFASFLTIDIGMNITIIYDDILRFANSIREISLLNREFPGRRNYPTYLYSELAWVYERCGSFDDRISQGTLTCIPIVPAENEDFTHPIIDLSGYITEGQIVTTRELVRSNFTVPIALSKSLSRMISSAARSTFRGHQEVSDQIYYAYSQALEAAAIAEFSSEEELTDDTRMLLRFKENFEENFLNQSLESQRTLEQSRVITFEIISLIPPVYLSNTVVAMLQEMNRQL